MSGDLGELIYFPVYAKGLQLAMCAEMSGMSWSGFTAEESGVKSWAEMKLSGIAPFGQMPLLKTPDGLVIGQSTAIANYIAKKAGAVLEGDSDKDYAVSQMLMAEGEDIYSMLGACNLANWKSIAERKEGEEAAKQFFATGLPAHLKSLEGLCKSNLSDEGKHSDAMFTSTGTTAGEIYLWGMLHQAVVAGGGAALATAKQVRGGGVEYVFAKTKMWYETLADDDRIKKVLSGDSAIGKLDPYFIDTPAFNEKNGIEDEGYGQANGYGTVAVDLAAEAKKMKETMKALRASQMDKPPAVAMKLNKKTGKMEEFKSDALTDDLPDEEVADVEIELPCGDDY